jgi:hypothetical protein
MQSWSEAGHGLRGVVSIDLNLKGPLAGMAEQKTFAPPAAQPMDLEVNFDRARVLATQQANSDGFTGHAAGVHSELGSQHGENHSGGVQPDRGVQFCVSV